MIVKNKTKMLDKVLSYITLSHLFTRLADYRKCLFSKSTRWTGKSYSGFKFEFGLPFTRFNIYSENPANVNLLPGQEGRP